MSLYTGFFTPTFDKCLSSYNNNPIIKQRVKSVIDRILEHPKVQSHFLDKIGKIDLRGKRRRHVGGKYIIIYAICDECMLLKHQKFNNCVNICNVAIKKRVIFFAFDKWNDIYSRQWFW